MVIVVVVVVADGSAVELSWEAEEVEEVDDEEDDDDDDGRSIFEEGAEWTAAGCASGGE